MKTRLFKLAGQLVRKASRPRFLARKTLASLCVLGAVATPAFADTLIFDNADPPLTTTFRSGTLPLGVAAYLRLGANNVTISQIAINAAPGQNGQLKFVIFADSAVPSDAGPLLFSDTVNVTASGTLSYILSNPLSFTLQAGQYYDIGAVFNGSSINYSFDGKPNTQNGISSIVENENVTNFASPTLAGHASADVSIRLYAVPEPSSLMLGGLGMAGLVGWRRRQGQTRL